MLEHHVDFKIEKYKCHNPRNANIPCGLQGLYVPKLKRWAVAAARHGTNVRAGGALADHFFREKRKNSCINRSVKVGGAWGMQTGMHHSCIYMNAPRNSWIRNAMVNGYCIK